MTFRAFATDYDGTLAEAGEVLPETIAALERLKAAGLKLMMVTGREAPQLMEIFDRLDLFDIAVCENGALLVFPATGEVRPIAAAPPAEFVAALKARGVTPLSVGQSVVATYSQFEAVAREEIARFRLPWQVILNKDSAMCLPLGVDKASGLRAAVAKLGLAPADVVAAGDAENDRPFLAACGLGVAVANALPDLKAMAGLVTDAPCGLGVVELIHRWLADPEALALLRR